jgi:hypothetical protein
MGLWKMRSSQWVGKYLPTKKGAAGQVEHESHVDSFFFTSRVLCIMNSYVRSKQWIIGIISKCWNVMSGEKDSICGETTPGSFIITMHQLMHLYWFVTLWQTRTELCLLSHPSHVAWLWQTFSYFPNWNPLCKDDDFRWFKKLWKICR